MLNLLAETGLRPLEAFPGKPKDWWLTECLTCQTRAHYRLEHLLDLKHGHTGCAACQLSASRQPWRERTGYLQAAIPHEEVITQLAKADYVPTTTIDQALRPDDFVVAQCMRCARITVKSVRDIKFKCSCHQNVRAAHPTDTKTSNLLAESNIEAVKWWDHDVNDEVLWATAKVRGRNEVAWRCPECGHQFTARPVDMRFPRCAVCQEKWLAERERLDALLVSEVPELAAAWADSDDPRTVMAGDWGLRQFRCPEGHRAKLSPHSYLSNGCPSCRAALTRQNRKTLAEYQPELAAQWHPTRNGSKTPADLTWDSQKTMWWLSDCCGYEWQDTPRDRDKYARLLCPACNSILGSLAWVDPGLAAEWAVTNRDSPTHVRPNANLPYTPTWVCANNPDHVWQSALSTRRFGAGCPECRESGKSKVELDHHEAAIEVFGGARSGVRLVSDEFESRPNWTADILINSGDESIVVEYDGAYWHRADAKILVDGRKTSDLLAAGHRVVRLREDDLAFLEFNHPMLLQLRVHSSAPRPLDVMQKIAVWLVETARPG